MMRIVICSQLITFLAIFSNGNSWVLPHAKMHQASFLQREHRSHFLSVLHARGKSPPSKSMLTKKAKKKKQKLPKLVIFDLDGCLWSPEMYEILHFMNGKGSPFTPDENDPKILRTAGGEPVKLLGYVRQALYELQYEEKWWNTYVGISSRTDQPKWAKELMEKFIIESEEGRGNNEKEIYPPFSMKQVFTDEICELAHDSKVLHFERILKRAPGKPKYTDCLFFDNELGNCQQVAKLGVTVCYCPRGVSEEDWNSAVENFPKTNGKIIGR